MLVRMMRSTALLLMLATVFSSVAQTTAPKQEKPMSHHAAGTFEVKMLPLPDKDDGLKRYGSEKQIHGGLEATSKGEMIAAGDLKTGNAGYAAMEMVTGTLDGKHGSFALQHMATMIGGAPEMKVIVTPGSGTGELQGLAGTFTIIVEGGKHSYIFDYTLPDGK